MDVKASWDYFGGGGWRGSQEGCFFDKNGPLGWTKVFEPITLEVGGRGVRR